MLMLRDSPAEILRQALIVNGIPIPIYVSSEPDLPDECLTIYDTAGLSEGRNMLDGETIQRYGVQLRIRARNYKEGWNIATIIKEILEKLHNQVLYVSTFEYELYHCAEISTIIPLPPVDKSSRRLFTINCLLVLRQTGLIV